MEAAPGAFLSVALCQYITSFLVQVLRLCSVSAKRNSELRVCIKTVRNQTYDTRRSQWT